MSLLFFRHPLQPTVSNLPRSDILTDISTLDSNLRTQPLASYQTSLQHPYLPDMLSSDMMSNSVLHATVFSEFHQRNLPSRYRRLYLAVGLERVERDCINYKSTTASSSAPMSGFYTSIFDEAGVPLRPRVLVETIGSVII